MNTLVQVIVDFFKRIIFDIIFKNKKQRADKQHQSDDDAHKPLRNFKNASPRHSTKVKENLALI